VSDRVQKLVDELAEVLGRSVAVDDPDIRLIAASPHLGAIDAARMDIILRRKTDPKVVAFARSLHLERLNGPRRIPGGAEIDTLPRVVIPLRDLGNLYGYLWLIDASPPVTDADVAVAASTASEIAKLLTAEAQASDLRHAEDAALVAALLSDDAERAADAASRAIRAGRLGRIDECRVAVLRLGPDGEGDGRIGAAHAGTVLRSALGGTLGAVVGDDFFVVSDEPQWTAVAGGRSVVGRPVWERLRSVLASRGLTYGAMGVSGRLGGELLHDAGERASYCADIAGRVPDYVGIAHWEQLGAWQLLYGLPWTMRTVELLHPGIEVLLRPEHRELAVTLATYFDFGGEAGATVEALCVHRATLHYRRNRIRALIGTGWESGWGRLGAHAALVLAAQLDPTFAPVGRPVAPGQAGKGRPVGRASSVRNGAGS